MSSKEREILFNQLSDLIFLSSLPIIEKVKLLEKIKEIITLPQLPIHPVFGYIH